MKNRVSIILAGILALSSSAILADQKTLDGKAIMKKVMHSFYYQGKDQRAQAHMEITDKQGRKRIRDFSIVRLNTQQETPNGDQKYYVYFKKPTDVKKLAFMAWKNVNQDDDRWLYLPALDLVKRIAASDERTSFVGSHFYYEDVSGRSLEKDHHKLIEQNDNQYVIESTPIDSQSVGFTHYRVWVDKTSFLPQKIDYFKDDSLYRQYETIKTEIIDGFHTIIQAQMTDHRTSGKTLIDYSAVKYDSNVPEKIFSERFLRKAPKKYLK